MTLSPDTAIRIKTLLWAFLALIFLIGAPLLWSVSPWVLAGVVVFGAVLGLAFHGIVRLIRRRRPHSRGALARSALAGAVLATGLVAAPIYWIVLQPAIKPIAVPRVTLTDGKRQVVFQGMVHIGSESFYRSVVYDMVRARDTGDLLYFEGVRPGTPEAEAWLDAALGASGGVNENYGRIASVCGLHFQGDFLDYLQQDETLHPDVTVAADVTTTEMFDEWKRLIAERPELAEALAVKQHPGGGIDGIVRLVDFVAGLRQEQQALLASVCRGFFTRQLNSAEAPDPLDAVIVDFRNRKLADRIAAAPDANIYIVYGSGHFPGLLKEMLARDPAWKIVATTWTTVILPPEDAVGRLGLDADTAAKALP